MKKSEVERNAEVGEELDFIEALALLDHDFDLKLLPVQIRLMEQPRLSLLSAIIDSTQYSYRKYGKLLRVAKLLRIFKNDDDLTRDAKVLTVVGDAALGAQDFTSCWSLCQKIINDELTKAWGICLKLGRSELFADLEAKMNLLGFALTYCETSDGGLLHDILEDIAEIRLAIHEQALEEERKAIKVEKIAAGVKQLTSQVSTTAQSLTTWLLPKIPLPTFKDRRAMKIETKQEQPNNEEDLKEDESEVSVKEEEIESDEIELDTDVDDLVPEGWGDE
jgi:hypothetical protein